MGDTFVLAPKFLTELNMLPESKLSSTAALVDSVLGKYSGVDLLLRDHLTSDICRGSLTRNLRELNQSSKYFHPSLLQQLLSFHSWPRSFMLLCKRSLVKPQIKVSFMVPCCLSSTVFRVSHINLLNDYRLGDPRRL